MPRSQGQASAVRDALTQAYLLQKKLLGRWVEAETGGWRQRCFGGKSLQPYLRKLESTFSVVTDSQDRIILERSDYGDILANLT